jgi:hypothetical protein
MKKTIPSGKCVEDEPGGKFCGYKELQVVHSDWSKGLVSK